jgi:hypothetical protein
VNIFVHVGHFTAGPVFYELADAAGLLAPSNVWINSAILRWGDIVRRSPGPYPNHGISAETSLARLDGMLHLSEVYNTEASWNRYQTAYTDPGNDRDDCACSSAGDAVANCAYNHTSFPGPGGGLDVLNGTVNGVWEHPLAHTSINRMAGMWGPPHELSGISYDCVIALAAAFAISDQTGGKWDGEQVMANMGRIDDFDGATGTVHLDSSGADRVADDSYKYSVFSWRLSSGTINSTLVARIGLRILAQTRASTWVFFTKCRACRRFGTSVLREHHGCHLSRRYHQRAAGQVRARRTCSNKRQLLLLLLQRARILPRYVDPLQSGAAQCLAADYEYSVAGCNDMVRTVKYSWKADASVRCEPYQHLLPAALKINCEYSQISRSTRPACRCLPDPRRSGD